MKQQDTHLRRGSSTSLAAASALALLALPSSARADRFDLSVGSSARWMHSSSVDALSADDSFAFFSLNGGIRMDRLRLPGFELLIDGTIERGSLDGLSFNRLRTEAAIWTYQLGVRARRDLASRVIGYGRASLGVQRTSIELTDSYSSGYAIHDKGYSSLLYLGGGLELSPMARKPDGSGASIAFRFEIGYLAATPMEVTTMPDSDLDDGTIRIPTTVSSMGRLNLSALALRLGVVGRF